MEHETKHEIKQTKKLSKNNIIIGGLVLTMIILVVISLQIRGLNSRLDSVDETILSLLGKTQPSQPRGEAPSQESISIIDMADLIDDDEVKGDKNAPVTIVEWSDFECPFCVRFYTQTLPQINREYIETGKAKFVYRDFPLNFHANAQKAAESAECAGEQGKYFEMHDKLFEEGVKDGVSSFRQFAADLGLDISGFNDCLDSGKMASEVQKDMNDGTAVGITGTPGFIINGKLVSGAQPFEVFKQVIDGELGK